MTSRKLAWFAGLAAIVAVVAFFYGKDRPPDSSAQTVVLVEDQNIDEFFEAVFEREVSLSPVSQSSLGRKTDQQGSWDDISDNAAAQQVPVPSDATGD